MNTAGVCLLAVHLEEEFTFYELRDAFTHSFGGSRAFAEDDAVIGITHERKPAPFKLAVEFRQHYVAQYRTQWTSLRHALCGVLILVSDHDTCVEILMYQ